MRQSTKSQTSKSPNEKLVCTSHMPVSKQGCLVCVRGHADIVQHFSTCATQWSGGSRDVRMGDVGMRHDWRTGWGEKCGSP